MTPTEIPSWWDPHSNQPYKLPAGEKPRATAANLAEYLKVAATTLLAAPPLLWKYSTARPGALQPEPKRFVGLSVSPDPRFDAAAVEMVEELGVEELLVRVHPWDVERLEETLSFMDRFPDCRFLVNVLQSRASIRDPDLWARQLERVFDALGARAKWFQVGNAVNRSKWGCRHSGDALRLFRIADEVRRDFPGVRLLGSSVIDFEPLVALRTLLNLAGYRMDGCAAQLYVNRRGPPTGKQYGYFDLERKIRLLHAMLALSNNTLPRLWITETNWPLLGTRPYTPNSGHPRSTVDEPTQARYLRDYYRIAWRTGWVEKVYWWQLINPGYGLVDHRGGKLRKMPSYHAFKALLAEGLEHDITATAIGNAKR